jgi:hypothetical protein
MIKRNYFHIALFSGLAWLALASCSPKNISSRFYYENEKTLDQIEQSYKELHKKREFAIAFTNKKFKTLSFEIITDTLTYIYEYDLDDPNLGPTLARYDLDVNEVLALAKLMRSIRCTWVNNFDYYIDEKKQSLTFISMRPVALNAPFTYKQYYILTYFNQKQTFDKDGRLVTGRQARRLYKINGEILHRINDKVCYTVSARFR